LLTAQLRCGDRRWRARALVAIGKQQFDVILLDLGMPDLNATEVLRFIADAPSTRR